MARHRSRAHAPLPWAAIPGMRSLYEHLLERLARLPRDAAGVLLRSAAALLRQVAAALLRLLRGPAQAGLPTSKNARPEPGNRPVRPGPQRGDAVKRAGLGGPAQAGEPISKRARRGPGKPPVRPGPQGGDAVKRVCLGGPAQTRATISEKPLRGPGKPPVRPGTQGGDAVKGAEVPELAESDPPVVKNSCSDFGEVPTTTTTPDNSIRDWKIVMSKKRSKIAPQFPLHQEKCCSYCKMEGHYTRDCPATKASVSSVSCCDPPRKPKAKEKCCSYCKMEGHYARDCPATKASVSSVSCCDPPRKPKAKHVNEENYNLDMLFAEEEEDAETKAHRLYHVKVCKKGHILCLACHLKGKEVLVKDKNEEMKTHCDNKHGPCYYWCDKSGCLAVADTKHDIGLHQYISHGI